MTEELASVTLRDGRLSDDGFIYTSWIRSIWGAEKRLSEFPSPDFYQQNARRIKAIMKDSIIKVAHFVDSPVLIIGYSVMHGEHLHFVYVKIDYRNSGIGKLLTSGFKTVSTPETKIGKAIVRDKSLVVPS